MKLLLRYDIVVPWEIREPKAALPSRRKKGAMPMYVTYTDIFITRI